MLRGGKEYVERFNKRHVEAKKIINSYQNLVEITQLEVGHLNVIRVTLQKYQSLLETVSKIYEDGQSIQKIDPAVKVDDKPALIAILKLHNYITTIDTSIWWKKNSFRLELIKQVSDIVRRDLVSEVQRTIETAENTLIFYLILTVFSILISMVIGYQIMRRMVDELENISSNMRRMQLSGNFDLQLKVKGNDEISEMAQAFNNLIDERNKNEAILGIILGFTELAMESNNAEQ